MCVISSVVMFCFVFDGKFRLPMGLHTGRRNMSKMLNKISQLRG